MKSIQGKALLLNGYQEPETRNIVSTSASISVVDVIT